MSESQTIGILMPVKNVAAFLQECLDSICQQSEPNWRLFAIDDYSSDNSFEILSSYAAKDDRIWVAKNTQEKGIISALHQAFAKAGNCSFITRMDADDRMAPQKLSKLKAQLLNSGKGHLATGHVSYFSATGLGAGYTRYQNWLNNLCAQNAHYKDIYKECVIPSPCWMVHTSDLNNCEAFEPQIYPEDYDLCFRFYKNKLKVLAVNEILHFWRDYPERTSRNDPHYSGHLFFDLKLPYFLALDYEKNRPLLLWGAGKKGKMIAKELVQKEIRFHWLTNNSNKVGHIISDQKLLDESTLSTFEMPHLIIAVAKPDEQKSIEKKLLENSLKKGKDYWFFC